MTDPTDLIGQLIAVFFGRDGQRDASHAAYAAMTVLALNGLCALLAAFIGTPKPGSRHFMLKKAIHVFLNWFAFNLREAANGKQCGMSALHVPHDSYEAARAALTAQGIEVLPRKKPDA